MKKIVILLTMSVFILVFTMCNKAGIFDESGYDDRLTGGAATVFDETSHAFTHVIDGLTERDVHVHELGDKTFEQTFVANPAPINGGLGPVFNNVSCISCHHNDGKGTPTAGFSTSSLLFRISIEGKDAHGGGIGAPGFGLQLQDQALIGSKPEVQVNINYTNVPVTYPDGTVVNLRQPSYTLYNPYTFLPTNYMISPRLAPPVFGGGLLENIPEETIRSYVDADDANKDGITGKANYVYNPYTHNQEIGRFGLKANTSTLQVQVAAAFQQDMGITSYIFPQEASFGQQQTANQQSNKDIPDSSLDATIFYVRTLAVPARRNTTDLDVKTGQKLFTTVNCSGCHKPTVQTGINLNLPALSNQRIHPYTDLLVHDMGSGLADGRSDYLATGNEWRTMPLWGIGLFSKTNGTPYYLHDGRATTIEQAILWHGGEAEKSKQSFMNLSKADRSKLLKFMQSL